ncbi:MAG: hypothetical protein HYW63_01495 [Candidatus Levybacteria bacterium]|nr:hypothetical protein [Candidatus Levybacteria bacterium]
MRQFFYCLIFPHHLNNHRASFLHHKTILFLISFFILSSLFFPSTLNPLGEKVKAFADISVAELIQATNQKRIENGLRPLSSNPQLSEAAGKKAEDMFAKNYWAHNSPTGTTPWVFIRQAGYNYIYAGENLARGFNSANDVVNAWMASPTHRANILSANYNDVGFSVKSGRLAGEQTFLVVQELGSKRILPAVNRSPSQNQKSVAAKRVLGFEIGSYLPIKPNFSKSSELVLLILLLFIAVFLIDLIIIERRKITRFVGHNLDHAIFLSIIILIISIFNTGMVL